MIPFCNRFKMARRPRRATVGADSAVDSIVAGNVKSIEELKQIAPHAVDWLKRSLPIAYKDKELKARVKRLLGASRFTSNLGHFHMWDSLLLDCKAEALAMGREMQQYFTDNDLGAVLGDELPNAYGKAQHVSSGTDVSGRDCDVLTVVPSDAANCSKRQDDVFPSVFPYDSKHSQLWNECCFIHCLRMIAMGVDALFQDAVGAVCESSDGDFKSTEIKGFVRMKNKATAVADHYCAAYPRFVPLNT